MANKVTVFPRPSQTKEPRELTIFALGDQRVVIDLRDGTSKVSDNRGSDLDREKAKAEKEEDPGNDQY
jgi:hypothetical protein